VWSVCGVCVSVCAVCVECEPEGVGVQVGVKGYRVLLPRYLSHFWPWVKPSTLNSKPETLKPEASP